AVVAHVLNHFEGALRLVDVSGELPALKRRPGMKTWKFMARDGSFHDSPETVEAGTATRGTRRHLEEFLPLSPERMDELHMERCMRIYPHLQNTGGFFVAVIEKVAPISVDEKKKAAEAAERISKRIDARAAARSENDKIAEDVQSVEGDQPVCKRQKVESGGDEEMAVDDSADKDIADDDIADDDSADEDTADGTPNVHGKRAPYLPDNPREDPALRENPFVFMDPSTSDLKAVLDYYGIKESMLGRGFLSRMENGMFRTVYYVADSVRQIMDYAGSRLRVVNTGIKVFGRSSVKEAGCAYRLVCEGVPQLLPHLGDKYVIEVPFADLKTLIEHVNPLLSLMSEETQRRVSKVAPSCSVIMCYDPAKHADDEEKPFTRLTALLSIPCWRGGASLSAHINKSQLRSLNHRVLGRVADKNSTFKLDNNARDSDSVAISADSPAVCADDA
ncbi:tRNA (cytosine-5-)-methyltransferase ncl1, partial [Coemansia sp. RSA 2440]